MEERRLPTTTYAILGMLTFGEMSGYDLSKFVERSIGYFWSPAKSQIYSELRRLVALGWATERRVAQDERPDKRVYGITKAGEEALRGWLHDPAVEPETYRSPFLLKLFFGHLMEPGALEAQLKEARRQAEEFLGDLRAIDRRIRDQESLFYPYLTLLCGIAHGRATSRWAAGALKRLEERREA